MVELGKDRYRIGLPVVIDVAKKLLQLLAQKHITSHIWNAFGMTMRQK